MTNFYNYLIFRYVYKTVSYNEVVFGLMSYV